MTDDRTADANPDSRPRDDDRGTIEQVDSPHGDQRSDLEQAVEARSDAVARGEGGDEPAEFTDDDTQGGIGGTGGEVKNQNDDAQ